MGETIQGYQLSLQQERLWQLARSAPEPFRARLTISLEGEVDAQALHAALRQVIERHEILRTRFALPPGMTSPLQVVAAAETSLAFSEEAAEPPAASPGHGAGGPEREPVMVARLDRSEHRHRLRIELPALCADAQTLANLAREIGRRYLECRHAAGAGDPGGEPLQYADFAGWQREAATAHDEAARKLWQAPGLAEALRARLPGGPGAAAAEPFVPRTVRFSLPAAAVERLAEAGAAGAAAGEPPVPASAVVLAAWMLLLQRHLGTPWVMVGVACSGRRFAELEDALGLFSRYVPCAADVPETLPLAAAAKGLAGRLAELASRQDSFSWDGLDVPEGTPRFFPFGFEWRELPPAWQVDGVRFSVDEIGVLVDRFAAKLTGVSRGAHPAEIIQAELLYDAAAIPEAQAELLAERLVALLRDAGERPAAAAGDLELLSGSERRQLLVELNRTAAELGGAGPWTLAALFEAQARRSPDAPALAADGVTLTYGELEGRANRLARRLRRLGVGPESRVALQVERSPELVIALLAIAKAGGAYVPVDPGYPRERRDFMLADCAASLLVVARRGEDATGGGLPVVCLDDLPAAAESPEPLPPSALPENLAYVIYTSGSTGRPKGVMVSHAAIANRLLWMQRDFPLAAGDRVLQKTPYSFDASIWEIFVPLLAGAEVVLAEPGGHRDSGYLLDAVARHQITVLQLVPSQLAAFVDQEGVAERCRTLRAMFCGGEALPGAVAERFLRGTGAALCNLYGPTEAAIDASFHVCPRGEPLPDVVPIGRPLANVRIYLADRLLRPVPPPLPGEILIGGAGLARGYLGRPELTAERFVPDPWGPPGGRLYRSGDLGSLAPGGVIEIRGRIDHQVKLRGIRIELGEIEARLREHPAVRDAVVLAREDVAGEPMLVGYVVRHSAAAAAAGRDDLCELPGGLRVACVNRNEAEVVYREVFTGGGYLRHGVELEDGACVVDVGANIGLFTLYVKQRFPASRVLAFEPIPAIFDKLRVNAALHGLGAELFACALAEREGTAPFTFYPAWSAMSGRYADAQDEQGVTRTILARDQLAATDIADLTAGRFAGEVVECPLKTLSQVLRENQVERIDLLKIDVEKSELDVLRGIEAEDWSRIGQIVIEVHDLDGRLETVRSLLTAQGFAVAVEQEEFLAGTPIWNLYCVRPGRGRRPAARTISAAAAATPATLAGPAIADAGAPAGDLQDLRAFLSARLPAAMVPQAIVDLDELPRLPNGKVDRAALAALGPATAAATAATTAGIAEPPRTPVEDLLTQIYADVLGLERVGVRDNFFVLGGHSLLATRLISRVRSAFQAEVSLRRFFDDPTIAGMAALLAEQGEVARPAAPPLLPVARGREIPLSFAQQRLWFIAQLVPGSGGYNLPMPLRIEGRLDPRLLGRTLSEVVRRHEALRTRFAAVEGRPVQVIDPPRPVRLPLADLSALPGPAAGAEARRLAGEDAHRPFDVSRDQLLRATVLRLDKGAADHALLFTMHHIVSDGWSTGVLVREVMALYEAFLAGRPSPLPELAIQYADFAVWQREWLRGEALEAQLDFWRQRLAGAPQVLELPLDRPRPASPASPGAPEVGAGVRRIALPPPLSVAVHELCRRQSATPFMVLLAAWAALLGRLAGQEDVLLGSPIAGRNRGEIEDLIGLFVNTLVMRTDLSGTLGFAALVGQVRRAALDGYAHQDLPFERLVEELAGERTLAHMPLVQVLFALQNAPFTRLAIPGLAVSPLAVGSGAVKFDLILTLVEGAAGPAADGFAGALEYDPGLFDGSTIERLAGHFIRLLAAAAADPERALPELPLLTPGERHQLVAEWHGTPLAAARGTLLLHELFAAQAARTPDAVALSEGQAGGVQLSYAELDRRASRLARSLRLLGVGPEVLVGLCVERTAGMLVGILGILGAGGAYVPLEPAYPERLPILLADTGAPVVVVQEALRDRLPAGSYRVVVLEEAAQEAVASEAGEPPRPAVLPENPVYVIYTSGSTGKPKGVVVSHRNVAWLFPACAPRFGFGPGDVWTLFHSFGFDFSVWEMWGALLHGGRVVVVPYWVSRSHEAFRELLVREGVTMLSQTPSALRQLLRAPGQETLAVRVLSLGGEALDPGNLRQWLERQAESTLMEVYGITETTVFVSSRVIAAAEPAGLGGSLIGRALAGLTGYVLDRRGELAPVGVAGELLVGGEGLARGYLGRPELTAERFVPHPFAAVSGDAGDAGERLYRSGDLVRYRPDGELEYLGRVDAQVKIRGFRIELGEVEIALASHPGVRDCAVLAREDVPGDRRLVAYAVLRPAPGGARPRVEDLRSHLRSRLPEYMIPAAFMLLEALPLTTSGKLDRRALPVPERTGSAGYVAPADAVEEILAGIWAEVLDLPRVGVHDDFFAIGGHSLLATQVISRIRGVLRVELPLREIFESPTVAGLARAVRALDAAAAGREAPPIVPRPREAGELPLSFAQQRLWFLDRLDPGSATYNVPLALRLRGSASVTGLSWIFAEVMRRHEALRTTFPSRQGQAVQVVAAAARPPLPVVDLSRLEEARREVLMRALAQGEARRPFDLERGPLLRLGLVRLAERDQVLLMTMHHIVSDGWSTGVLVKEIAALHAGLSAGAEGRAADLPELPVQYADFALWQRDWLRGEVLEEQIAHWRRQLAGAPRVLELPFDRPRPARQSFRGAERRQDLSPDLGAAVRRLARREDATPFMVLLAAWGLLLGRYAGQQDVVVGTPIAGRNRQEIENLIGFFVNTLALRVDGRGAPDVSELVARVRAAALDGYARQDLPFERLVDELAGERGLAVSPLFQAVFALHNTGGPGGRREKLSLPGLTLASLAVDPGVAKFDLTLTLAELDDPGFAGAALYSTALFDAATVDRLLGHFATLLAGFTATPRAPAWELPLLGQAERRELLAWSGAGESYAPAGSLAARFEARAAERPEAVAAVCADASLTYGELDRLADGLAHRLLAAGVAPGSRVCLAVERGLGLVAGILGILKAGCAYVPLDPSYPRERLAWMLEDAGAAALVTEAGMAGRLPAWAGRVLLLGELGEGREEIGLAQRPRVAAAPEWPAYVIYTSGSTGQPKGVVVTHGNVLRLMAATEERFAFGAADTWTLFHSYAFDFSVWELWGALLYGGRLVVVPYVVSRSPQAMLDLVEREEVTVLNQTPSAFQAFQHAAAQREAAAAPSLRWVVFGGEALQPQSLEGWWRRRERLGIAAPGLVNMYGITETTVHVTWRRLGEAEILGGAGSVIGVPLGDLRVLVLDPWGKLVPPGVAGELHVGGDGVSPGYLGRPELTAERFVPDAFGTRPGERLYRSGDLGRWRRGGELEYLGRIDAQVKVRGFRIEPAEIEAVLRNQPGVRDCVVLAREDVPGDRRLVAYVVGAAPAVEELRRRLLQSLPEHMVPAAFVALAELPLTPNGKVDRRALPAPGGERPELGADYAAPRSEVEEVLAAIWAQVLGLGRVGIHDNFFALGGDSILSVRVAALARERGLEVELADLFSSQTIAELGATVRRAQGEAAAALSQPLGLISAADRAKLPAGIEDAYPLTLLQAGMLFHMDLAPGDPPYHNVASWHLRARFAASLFERAVARVLARHPVLRTSFDLTGYSEPLQLVHRWSEQARLPVPVFDLGGLPPARHRQVLRGFVDGERTRLLDRARTPQLRFHVHLRTAESFQLTLTENHAILDGWSLHSTLSEIFSGYFALLAGRELPEEAPPAASFRDFVRLERLAVESAEQTRFWDERLRGAAMTSLPPAGGPIRSGPRSRVIDLPVPPPVEAGLRRLAREAMVPLKSTLLAAHLKVMALVSGQREVVTGMTTHGRQEAAGGEDVRGLFLNMLPFRFRVAEGTWGDLARDAFQAESEVWPFRRYPLAALQNRHGGQVLETVFNYVHFHAVEEVLRSGNVEVLGATRVEGTNFALTVTATQSPLTAELQLSLEHDRSRLTDGRARWWLGELYQRVLAAMAAESSGRHDAAALLTPGERHQLLREWNDTRAPFPETTLLHQFFEASAARSPDAVAAVCAGRELSYAELEAWSNRLARLLRHRLGLERGAPVGVWVERSLDMLAAVLGVLKAGGHYVALDAAWPAERVEAILAATGAPALVAGSGLLVQVEEMRWRLPRLSNVVCLDVAAPEPPVEAIDPGSVRELWDLVAERAVDRVTAGGFVSAFTGEPMSEAEVDEYRDRVLSLAGPWLRPGARVLEVGNGSGLLLWEMAARAARVTGVDPSPLTQERNREHAAREGLANVELLTGFAHELEELVGAQERFDLVVLASTVQFFPGPRYLERVLRWALGRLAPGGALLVADVPDARRRGELRRAVEEHRGALLEAPIDSDRRTVLDLDEGFFQELGATVHHRTEGFPNELRFRYDVLLAGGGRAAAAAERRQRLWTGWHVAGCPAGALPAVATPDDVAYVIHTSGSTGEPKGIVVQHRPAANLVDWINRTFEVGPEDRGLFVASLCFDLSVYDIFGLLGAGGAVHVARGEDLADPDRLVGLLRSGGITLWDSAPAALVQLAPLFPAAPDASSRLRRVLLSGDWIPVTLPDRVRRAFPGARVMALGGATEATVWSNWFPVDVVDPAWPSIPYGRPIANASYHVLDAAFTPSPIGAPGALYIGGDCLCAGYARAELTAAAFLPDPFSGMAGARLYRTGDQARYRADGNLEFLGRLDQQVKVRGFRIELGEIEVVLARHPGVRDCVVLAPESAPGDRRLVAYVVSRGEALDAASLRQYLRQRLPEPMVPAAVVSVAALPVTSNGKVDRQALLRMTSEIERPAGELVGPRTPVEELLAGIWTQVLQRERVGMEESFFDLGGHSLLATQVTSRIKDVFGVAMPLGDLFAAPTVAGLAVRIEALRSAGVGLERPPLRRVDLRERSRQLPSSFAQQRLWFLDQLEGGGSSYNVPMALELAGRLEPAALAAAWRAVVRRHEVLRTCFPAADPQTGQVMQVVSEQLAIGLPIVDLRPLAARADGGRQEASRLARAAALEPFDLRRSPLLRTLLLRLPSRSEAGQASEAGEAGERRHLLVACLHHIICDGWSLVILRRELAALYGAAVAGLPSPLPPLPVQYGDFAAWQRTWLAGDVLAAELDHWRRRLAGAPALLALPADRPRPAVQSYRGAQRSLALPGPLAGHLRELGRREGTTLFMTLLAAWGAQLARLTGGDDVPVGSPIANRNQIETEPLIGFFANTLVLRLDLAGDPTRGELLGRVRELTLEAFAHQDLPFEKLVEELRPERTLAHSPLFQALFALQHEEARSELPGVRAGQLPLPVETAKFDLMLGVTAEAAGLTLGLEFSRDLFDAATATRLLTGLAALLEEFAGATHGRGLRLSELPLLGAGERHQLVREWEGTRLAAGERRLPHEQFAAQAARRPDAVALSEGRPEGGVQLSYAELGRRASRLARRLRALGVGPEVLVGLCAERTAGMVVAILAILEAGGAYVPLDPAYPEERLHTLLTDTGAPVVVVQAALRDRLPAGSYRVVELEDANLEAAAPQAPGPPGTDEPAWPAVLPENPAYVIHTSGSTGKPKGVVVSHSNVAWLFAATAPRFGFGPEDVWTLFHSFAFDFSVWEMWGALLHGGRMVVVPYLVSRSPEAFRELLVREGVTMVSQTPSAFRQLLRAPGQGKLAVRVLSLGGEALDPGSLLQWLERQEESTLMEVYGITETTVFVSSRVITAAEPAGLAGSIIGRTLAGLTGYVLDRRGELAPLGVAGELLIGGEGLTRGYLGRRELTAERFVPHPFAASPGDAGGRLYRSGDLVRFRPNGELEYLGRVDAQVKIRGFRIELGEVEAVLSAHPEVAAAAVLVREDQPGDRRLVAYVVPRTGALDAAALRHYLQRRLPEPMVPAALVGLEALPLNRNGKVDRQALSRMAPETETAAAELVAPRTTTEELLAGIWAQVLGRERIGVEESFFDLGGHSLLATRVTSRVTEIFGVTIPLRALFDAPTVAGLAVQIDALRAAGAGPHRAPLGRADRSRPLPASFAQQRLWFLDQLDPGSSLYNVPAAQALTGPLGVAALAAALGEVVRRHEVLRTSFGTVDGEPVQIISPRAAVAMPLIDLRCLPAPPRTREAERLADAEARRPFDLGRGPLLRSALLRLEAERHVLLLTMHHIVCDGWSRRVLVRELNALYEAFLAGRPSPLPPLPVQYADFSAWQRSWLRGERLAEELAYWTRHLDGAPSLLALPFDRPRPALPSHRGGAHRFRIPREAAASLKALGRSEGSTLFMTVLAAFGILLHRYSGQSDLVVGSNIANRQALSLEGLIGLFANTVVLRLAWTEEPTVRELLARVREVVLEAQAHQDFPFEKLVEALRPERDETHHPLFQVMLVMQETMPQTGAAASAPAPAPLGVEIRSAKFDLTLFVAEDAEQIAAELEYDADLFEAGTIADLAGQLAAVLQALPAAVDQPISAVPLVSALEEESLVGAFAEDVER
jgi:amino acid adenylation domain-containing protein/FkbM family methyltransferase